MRTPPYRSRRTRSCEKRAARWWQRAGGAGVVAWRRGKTRQRGAAWFSCAQREKRQGDAYGAWRYQAARFSSISMLPSAAERHLLTAISCCVSMRAKRAQEDKRGRRGVGSGGHQKNESGRRENRGKRRRRHGKHQGGEGAEGGVAAHMRRRRRRAAAWKNGIMKNRRLSLPNWRRRLGACRASANTTQRIWRRRPLPAKISERILHHVRADARRQQRHGGCSSSSHGIAAAFADAASGQHAREERRWRLAGGKWRNRGGRTRFARRASRIARASWRRLRDEYR